MDDPQATLFLSKVMGPIMNVGGLDPVRGQEKSYEEIFYEKVDRFFIFYPASQLAADLFRRGIGRWLFGESPGSPYKGLFGTRTDNFTPNINIQEEKFDGPMDQYIRLNMIQLEKLMKAKKVNQSPFSVHNYSGVKLITHTQYNDMKLTQTFYFFENPAGKKVVVTATANRGSGSEYDPVFDGIMNSFQME